MRHKYKLAFSANLCSVIPEVALLCDNLNEHMSEFGVNEKLAIHSDMLDAEASFARELTPEEIVQFKAIMLDTVKEALPGMEIKIASFQHVGPTSD